MINSLPRDALRTISVREVDRQLLSPDWLDGQGPLTYALNPSPPHEPPPDDDGDDNGDDDADDVMAVIGNLVGDMVMVAIVMHQGVMDTTALASLIEIKARGVGSNGLQSLCPHPHTLECLYWILDL